MAAIEGRADPLPWNGYLVALAAYQVVVKRRPKDEITLRNRRG